MHFDKNALIFFTGRGIKMLNRQTIIGNVGDIGELKGRDSNIIEFSIATEERWKDSNGEWCKETEWHQIKLFGTRAIEMSNRIKKGDQLFVEGKTKTEKWTRDGMSYTRKVVYASMAKILNSKKEYVKTEPTDEVGF